MSKNDPIDLFAISLEDISMEEENLALWTLLEDVNAGIVPEILKKEETFYQISSLIIGEQDDVVQLVLKLICSVSDGFPHLAETMMNSSIYRNFRKVIQDSESLSPAVFLTMFDALISLSTTPQIFDKIVNDGLWSIVKIHYEDNLKFHSVVILSNVIRDVLRLLSKNSSSKTSANNCITSMLSTIVRSSPEAWVKFCDADGNEVMKNFIKNSPNDRAAGVAAFMLVNIFSTFGGRPTGQRVKYWFEKKKVGGEEWTDEEAVYREAKTYRMRAIKTKPRIFEPASSVYSLPNGAQMKQKETIEQFVHKTKLVNTLLSVYTIMKQRIADHKKKRFPNDGFQSTLDFNEGTLQKIQDLLLRARCTYITDTTKAEMSDFFKKYHRNLRFEHQQAHRKELDLRMDPVAKRFLVPQFYSKKEIVEIKDLELMSRLTYPSQVEIVQHISFLKRLRIETTAFRNAVPFRLKHIKMDKDYFVIDGCLFNRHDKITKLLEERKHIYVRILEIDSDDGLKYLQINGKLHVSHVWYSKFSVNKLPLQYITQLLSKNSFPLKSIDIRVLDPNDPILHTLIETDELFAWTVNSGSTIWRDFAMTTTLPALYLLNVQLDANDIIKLIQSVISRDEDYVRTIGVTASQTNNLRVGIQYLIQCYFPAAKCVNSPSGFTIVLDKRNVKVFNRDIRRNEKTIHLIVIQRANNYTVGREKEVMGLDGKLAADAATKQAQEEPPVASASAFSDAGPSTPTSNAAPSTEIMKTRGRRAKDNK
ncbi:hypothetical protein CRE_26339 [Caenorhabditis remanei]|uniref:Uncharacterized protein n=1 Tax=Caenorhabditis remanei TaxID=31234 RepID=E3LRI1_CAERE|nr:hypothetical protein CRE_26339 [Caenorhabditis remanei]